MCSSLIHGKQKLPFFILFFYFYDWLQEGTPLKKKLDEFGTFLAKVIASWLIYCFSNTRVVLLVNIALFHSNCLIDQINYPTVIAFFVLSAWQI